MKPITINKNSWHYKLASNVVGYIDDGNFCNYSSSIIKALFILAFAFFIIGCVFFAFSHMILGIAFSIIYKTWLMSVIGEITLLVCTIILCSVSIVYILEYIRTRKNKYLTEKSNSSVLRNMYSSWKEKYCAKVIFIDSSEENPNENS